MTNSKFLFRFCAGITLFIFSLTACTEVSEQQKNHYDTEVISDAAESTDVTAVAPKAERVAYTKNKVYNLYELERRPVFSEACLTDEDVKMCSNTAMANFLKKNLIYPDKAEGLGLESTEVVNFTLNEKGEIEDLIKVVSQNSTCTECQKEAVRVVGMMPKWTPGMKNGKPVRTNMTIPIKFRIENT